MTSLDLFRLASKIRQLSSHRKDIQVAFKDVLSKIWKLVEAQIQKAAATGTPVTVLTLLKEKKKKKNQKNQVKRPF